MYEIIYNIYIGDYHYETCIDKEGLSIILHKAKQDFPGKEIRVVKENIPIEQIHKMIQDKIDDNERVWEEAKKTDDVIGYVNRYWARKDFDSLRLAFLNT